MKFEAENLLKGYLELLESQRKIEESIEGIFYGSKVVDLSLEDKANLEKLLNYITSSIKPKEYDVKFFELMQLLKKIETDVEDNKL